MLLLVFIFLVIPLVLLAIFHKKIKNSKILDKFRKDKRKLNFNIKYFKNLSNFLKSS